MRLAAKKVGAGSHPNEVMVSVETTDGEERLVVHQRALSQDGKLDIGYPISQSNDRYLVELPRETLRGSWRVWVREKLVTA